MVLSNFNHAVFRDTKELCYWKLILVYGLFGHISPADCILEKDLKKGTTFLPTIDKQELKLLVLTFRTIEEDYIVLVSVWQIIKLTARSMKGLTHLKKNSQEHKRPPKPQKQKTTTKHPLNKQQSTTKQRNKQTAPKNSTPPSPKLHIIWSHSIHRLSPLRRAWNLCHCEHLQFLSLPKVVSTSN